MTPSDEPLLSNLTYSMAYAQQGDIVFLTTDGVSDNFDPVVQRLQSITRAGSDGDQNIAVVSSPAISPISTFPLSSISCFLKMF